MQSSKTILSHEFVAPDIILFKQVLDHSDIDLILNAQAEKIFEMDLSHNSYYESLESRPEISFVSIESQVSYILNRISQNIVDTLVGIYGNVGVRGGSPFRYNEYKPGRGYKYHVDRSNNAPHLRDREISLIFGLNDEYTGGILRFPRQNAEIKLRAGEAIVFPSNYTHPHEVTPVVDGVRKTIVTWLN
jgi:hypothetical protein